MENEEAADKTRQLARQERLGLIELSTKDPEAFKTLVKNQYRYLDPQNQDFVESAQGNQLAIDDWTPLLRQILQKMEGNPSLDEMQTMAPDLVAQQILARQNDLTPISQASTDSGATTSIPDDRVRPEPPLKWPPFQPRLYFP